MYCFWGSIVVYYYTSTSNLCRNSVFLVPVLFNLFDCESFNKISSSKKVIWALLSWIFIKFLHAQNILHLPFLFLYNSIPLYNIVYTHKFKIISLKLQQFYLCNFLESCLDKWFDQTLKTNKLNHKL